MNGGREGEDEERQRGEKERRKEKEGTEEVAQKKAHHDHGSLMSLCSSKMEMEFEVLVLLCCPEVPLWSPMIHLADLQHRPALQLLCGLGWSCIPEDLC